MRLILILAILLTSCTPWRRERGDAVTCLLEERTGHLVVWDRKQKVEYLVDNLLEEPLSVTTAIQIGLINSPIVQTKLEEIGIAEAELVQASLLSNPLFECAVRLPTRNAPNINIQTGVVLSFVNLLLLPIRKDVARIHLEGIKAAVEDALLSYIEEVSHVYFTLQQEKSEIAIQEEIVELKEIAYLVAEKIFSAGNANIIEKESYFIAHRQARIVLKEMENNYATAEANFKKLLGLACEITLLPQGDLLPEGEILPLEVALERRLDLLSLRYQLAEMCRRFGLYVPLAYTHGLAGATMQLENNGLIGVGPAIGMAIPIFDYGQADRLMLSAEVYRLLHEYAAKEIEISSLYHASVERLDREKVIFHNQTEEVLPTWRKRLDETTRLYNYMNASVYDLLQIKEEECVTKKRAAKSYAQSWMEWATLLRLTGGGL